MIDQSALHGGVSIGAALWERIDELAAHLAALEEENFRLRQAAAAAVHDARAQLTNLSGFAQLLVQREGGHIDETSQSFLAYMFRAIGDMRGLFDRLLDDHREPWRRPVPLSDVLRDVKNTLHLRLARSGANLVADDLPTVPGDRRQLERLFANLVGNALKHPHPVRPLTIVVAAAAVAGGIEVSVTDNGTGIPPEALDRIWGLFEQASSEAPGAGIGLTICQAIAQHHGGRVTGSSHPRGGARFVVYLPTAPRQEPSPQDGPHADFRGATDPRDLDPDPGHVRPSS
jgi:signal transduction histidine kinase